MIRSDLPGRLTDQGRQALLDYGVRTIIDLRPPWEVREALPIFMEPTDGTDRTGTVSGLLLSMVGVPAELVAADYAASQPRLQPVYKNSAEAEDENKEDRGFWPRPTATADMMHMILAHVDRIYGRAQEYLEQAGLSPAEITCLKQRLRAV